MTWIDVPALDAVLLAGSLQRLIPVRSERHVQALHLCWTRTPKRSDPAAQRANSMLTANPSRGRFWAHFLTAVSIDDRDS